MCHGYVYSNVSPILMAPHTLIAHDEPQNSLDRGMWRGSRVWRIRFWSCGRTIDAGTLARLHHQALHGPALDAPTVSGLGQRDTGRILR